MQKYMYQRHVNTSEYKRDYMKGGQLPPGLPRITGYYHLSTKNEGGDEMSSKERGGVGKGIDSS